MKWTLLKIQGVFRVDLEPSADERGFFARTFCEQEFKDKGLEYKILQASQSFNQKAGTVRGMHYQKAPGEEAKLVSCTRGSIFDVILDLRPASPSFGRWEAVTLDAKNGAAVYVPKGCAHGFQALENETTVYYQMFECYNPALAAGVRYNDPRFDIRWPKAVSVISQKDMSYPDFDLTTLKR